MKAGAGIEAKNGLNDIFPGDEYPDVSKRSSSEKIIEQIDALLSLDAADALVPHGIGGLAREILTAARAEIEWLKAEKQWQPIEGLKGK